MVRALALGLLYIRCVLFLHSLYQNNMAFIFIFSDKKRNILYYFPDIYSDFKIMEDIRLILTVPWWASIREREQMIFFLLKCPNNMLLLLIIQLRLSVFIWFCICPSDWVWRAEWICSWTKTNEFMCSAGKLTHELCTCGLLCVWLQSLDTVEGVAFVKHGRASFPILDDQRVHTTRGGSQESLCRRLSVSLARFS